MKRNNQKRGFTIVELVIVIAVIAILAAVLIPTYANLVKKANEAKAQADAKNLITAMLADILTREEGENNADLLVFSHSGSDVYLHGYSASAGRVMKYDGEFPAFSGADFGKYVDETLIPQLKTEGRIVLVNGLAADDWRQPAKTAEIVAALNESGEMVVRADYTINVATFVEAPAMTVNGKAYDTLADAIKDAKAGDTITLCKDGKVDFTTTEPTTLKNVTFKAAEGVTVDSLKVYSETSASKITLDGIVFEGITFTDQVVIGQSTSSYGYSQCSNITFRNCKFDLSKSTEEDKDAIKRFGVAVSGNISEKETVAYMDGLVIENCEFTNCRYAVFGGRARNITITNCKFTNLSEHAIRFDDVAGNVEISGNTADNTGGMLRISTVGNNYSTTDIRTNVTIKNNTATNMTCSNGRVFYATFDNARSSGKSTYTITGNTCTYTQQFDKPLNGFKIVSNYSPSKAEFIENK